MIHSMITYEDLPAAGATYQAARQRADAMLAKPREDLARAVRIAYAGGVRKADILREIGHAWSRQWLDETVRDIKPGGLGTPPADWWAGLDDNDRQAYRAAVARPYPMPHDLAKKMLDAGVLVAWVGFEGQQMEPVFPRRYIEFIRRWVDRSRDEDE